MNGTLAYLLSKKYTNDSLDGITTLKGKNCQISDIDTSDDSKAVITFSYYDGSDVLKTEELEVPYMNEKNIADIDATHDDTNNKTVITFTLNDGTIETFDIVDGVEGNGIESITKQDTSIAHVITIKFTDTTKADATFTFARLQKWFSGNMIVEGIVVDTSNFINGDFYFNTVTSDVLSPNSTTGKWEVVCNLKGSSGASAYDTYRELHPGATREEFIVAISGDGIQMERVWNKPDILDRTTEINKWYFYQVNNPDSADVIHAMKDTGSYILSNGVNAKSVAVTLASGSKYYWNAWMEGKEMVLTMPSNVILYAGDTISIQYDLTGYEDIPSTLRPENVAIIYKADSLGNTTLIGRVTGDDIVRVDDADLPSEAIDLSDTLGSILTANKITDVLSQSSAWEGISNFRNDVEIPAGNIALWDGTRYVCFTIPFSIDASDFVDYYPNGIAFFTHEERKRGWLIGKNEDEELILLNGNGTDLTYSDVVPTGYLNLSEYFNEYNLLGNYNQTIYVGNSKSDAADVTISTGSATMGAFVTQSTWTEVISPTTELVTTDKTVKGAINEVENKRSALYEQVNDHILEFNAFKTTVNETLATKLNKTDFSFDATTQKLTITL